MSGCGDHQNYCDQQGQIGPLDAIFGGHDTSPFCTQVFFVLSAFRSFALQVVATRPDYVPSIGSWHVMQ